MIELDTYQRYMVGKYVSSFIGNNDKKNNENNKTDVFYFVLGSLVKDYYPDCYNYLLINYNMTLMATRI